MVTEAAPLQPITRSGPWRGLNGLTGAEARRWLPWRSLVLVGVGLAVLVLNFVIWQIAGADTESNIRLGSLMYPFFTLWAIAPYVGDGNCRTGSSRRGGG